MLVEIVYWNMNRTSWTDYEVLSLSKPEDLPEEFEARTGVALKDAEKYNIDIVFLD